MTDALGSGGVPEDVSRLRVRTVEILPGEVVLIDQLALPHEERYVRCRTWQEVAARITDMTVRGAPAIGVTAAGGLALAAAAAAAASAADRGAFRAALEQAASGLLATRPTAVNLRWAVDEMRLVWTACDEPPAACAARLLARAQAILDDDIERCLRIGEHGAALFKAGDTILTHCNAGALATAGYGTALGVVRAAIARHGGISVLVDETRPLAAGRPAHGLGARRRGHPVPAHQRQHGRALHPARRRGRRRRRRRPHRRQRRHGQQDRHVHRLGAGQGARRAVLRRRAAAPPSTSRSTSGAGIPIEERAEAEVTSFHGRQVAPDGARAYHPAFDVTPAANITAIVTEAGVLRAPFAQSLAAACAAGECES